MSLFFKKRQHPYFKFLVGVVLPPRLTAGRPTDGRHLLIGLVYLIPYYARFCLVPGFKYILGVVGGKCTRVAVPLERQPSILPDEREGKVHLQF